MRTNFWKNLEKPFFILAPMADVTDIPFRTMFAKYGKPDVLWTEFVSADGLMSEGRGVLIRDLAYSENERPVVAQFFTSKPENMKHVSILSKEMGFDGIDINMGCPDRSIEKQKSGAYLMKDPNLAKELISAAKFSGLPVSVKTRIGYNKDEIEEWIPKLLECEIDALTIHCRTRKQMSDVSADWSVLKKIVRLRDNISPNTLIIGNGDVASMADAKDKAKEFKCDGVMVGRGAFGNPWFFKDGYTPSVKEKLKVLIEHTELFVQKLADIKSLNIMKKHYKAYVNGFDGAKSLRVKLMDSSSVEEIKNHIAIFLKENPEY